MNTPTRTQLIPESLAGLRLDQALARMFPDFSRSRLKAWLLAGKILVDGESPKPRDRVGGGEEVRLTAEPDAAVVDSPQAIELDVAYEDDALLVIDKPAGLVVHPGAGNPSGTLLNGLLHYLPDLNALPRAGIVHRIDKDTTGLMLIGKTLPAHTALVRMLAEREISRRYFAVCRGVLTGGATIDAPIGRHRTDRTRMAVVDGGRPAVSHFTVAERFRAHSSVEVRLETGRTHQIRVHFAHRGNPLVGDPLYGGRLALPKGAGEALADALRGFRRQALHAARLTFEHPIDARTVDVEAPLPDDMAQLLSALREDR